MEKIREISSKDRGDDIYNLWMEYENCRTKEAKFIKALDKLETLTYLIEKGHKHYDLPSMIATYADKAVKNFPELKGMLKMIKSKLKDEYTKGNILWKEEYDSFD